MNPSLIIEQSIFSEATMIKETPSKAIFRCPIQSVDEVNQNHRLYPSDVLGDDDADKMNMKNKKKPEQESQQQD